MYWMKTALVHHSKLDICQTVRISRLEGVKVTTGEHYGISPGDYIRTLLRKLLIGLNSYLTDEVIIGLPIHGQLLVTPTEFPPFPGLSLIEQFLCILRHTAHWINLKFGR